MDEMNENSFIGDISLDFEQSIKSAESFAETIGNVSNLFENLSKNVKNLNSDLSESIKKYMGDIDKLDLSSNKLDIKSVLENKVATAIDKSLKNSTFDTSGFNYTFTQAQNNSISRKIKELVTDTISNIKFNENQLKSLNLTAPITKIIREQLQEQINKVLSANLNKVTIKDISKLSDNEIDNVVDDLTTDLFKDKKKKVKTPKNEIEELFNKLRSDVEKSLADMFEPLKNFKPEKIGKIDVTKFYNIVKGIEDVFKDVDKEFSEVEGDVSGKIDKLSELKKIVESFKQNENALLTEIGEILDLIVDFNNTLKGDILLKIKTIFTSINTQFMKKLSDSLEEFNSKVLTVSEGSINIGSYISKIKKIQSLIDKQIKNMLNSLFIAYEESLKTMFTKVGDKEISVSSIEQLSNKLKTAINKSLKDIKFSSLELSSEEIEGIIKGWSDIVEGKVKDFVVSLSSSSDMFLDVYKDVVSTISDSLVSYLDKIKTGISFNLNEKEFNNLQSKIENSLKDSIKNIEVVYDKNNIGVKLPNSALNSLSKKINDYIKEYIEKFVSSSDLGVEKSDNVINKTLQDKINNFINSFKDTIENKLNQIIKDFSVVEFDDVSKIDGEKYINEYKNVLNSFINNFQETVDYLILSLNTMNEAHVMLKEKMGSIKDKLISSLKSMDVENTVKDKLKGGAENINVKDNTKVYEGIVKSVISKLNSVIRNAMLEGVQSVSVDTSTLVKTSNSSVKKLLAVYTKEIKNQVNNFITEVSNLTNENNPLFSVKYSIEKIQMSLFKYIDNCAKNIDKIFNNPVSVDYGISVDNIPNSIKRSLAKYFNVSMEEFNEQLNKISSESNIKTLSFGDIVETDTNIIVSKFNETLLKVLSGVTDSHLKSFKEIEVQPESFYSYLFNKFSDIQRDIVEQVKKVLDKQFKFLKKEIKGLRVEPYSLNYPQPIGLSTKSVTSGGGGISSSGKSILNENVTPKDLDSILGKYLKEDTTENLSGSALTYRNMKGAVLNTIRYMTAGSLIGMPSMMMWEGFNSTKEFDKSLTMAQQNFLMKDSTMRGVAEEVVNEKYKNKEISSEQYNDESQRKKLIDETADNLVKMTRDGVVKQLQDYAITYGLKQEDVGTAWYIASKRIENPQEALPVAKNISKLYSFERDSNPEDIGKGLEAILSQWGLRGTASSKISDMMIKADAESQASVKDLMEVQQRAGAVFANFMPGSTKSDAFANSLALSSLAVQATARSGTDIGTFWKTVFMNPFTKGEKYLKEYSLRPGFEMLAPYTYKKLPNGKVEQEQKSGVEMFKDILEAMKKMTPEARNDLLKKVYGDRNSYGVLALNEVFDTLNKKGQSYEQYVNSIKNVNSEDINKAIISRQGTWDYNIQRVKTSWDATFFDVSDKLKGQFSSIVGSLSSFLDLVRKNASLIASLIKVGADIAVGLGAKWAYNKVVSLGDRIQKEKLSKTATEKFSGLKDEGEFLNLKRTALLEDLNRYQEGINRTQVKKAEINEPYSKLVGARSEVQDKIISGQKYLNTLTDEKEIKQQEEYLKSLGNEYKRITKEIEEYEKQLKQLDNQKDVFVNGCKKIQLSLEENDREMADLINRAKILDMAFNELGVKGGSVSSSVTKLGMGFKTGSDYSAILDSRIKELASDLGLSDFKLRDFSKDIDTLVKKFKAGEISADEFARSIKYLKRTYELNKLGATDVTGNADELVKDVTARSMMNDKTKKAVENVAGGVGIVGLVKKLFGGGKAVKTGEEVAEVGEGVSKTGGLLGLLKGFGSVGGFLAGAKSLVSSSGIGLLASGAMSVGTDLLESYTSSPKDRLSLSANKKNDLLDLTQNVSNSNILGKIFSGGLLAGDTLLGSISHMLGGSAPSLTDYLNSWRAIINGKKAVDDYVKKEKDKINKDLAKAEGSKENEDDGGLDEKTSKQNDQADDGGALGTKSISSQIADKYDLMLADLEAKFEEDKANLIIEGYDENSQQLSDLMNKFLTDNISILQQGISEMEKQKEAIEKSNPNYKDDEDWKSLAKDIDSKRVEIAKDREEIENNKYQAVTEDIDKFNRNKSLIEDKYKISEDNLILSGVSKDSMQMKLLDKSELTEENNSISQTISSLTDLMNSYSVGDSRRDKIFLEIQNLQAESKDNLVKIYEALTSGKSTFNLPPDIHPLTYWEAVTKGNTHNNVTVRSGDVIVNVNVSNMTGSNSDVQNVTNAISEKISEIQRGLANSLASQVKSGMASSYRPI